MKSNQILNCIYTTLLFIVMVSTVAMQSEKDVKILQHAFLLQTLPTSQTTCVVLVEIPLNERNYELVLSDAQDQSKFTYEFQVKRENTGWVCNKQEGSKSQIVESHTIALSVEVPSKLVPEIEKMFVVIKNQNSRVSRQSEQQIVSKIVKF